MKTDLISYKILLSLACLSALGCTKKAADAVLSSVNAAAPVIGTAISFTNVTSTSLTIQWGAATDDVTAQADLSYKLLYSGSDNLTTLTDAETNGTVVFDWTANTLTANILSLSATTTYFFATLVKDADGNKALYSGSTSTLCSGKVIYLVSVSNGNLGGISGADSICNSNKPTGLSSSTFKALISDTSTRLACTGGGGNCTSSSTGRADWPLPVSATLCSSDFTKKVGTTSSNAILTVSSTSLLASVSTKAYTGVNISWGPATTNNCADWTSSAGGQSGTYGDAVLSGQDFYAANSLTCNNAANIYCVEQ